MVFENFLEYLIKIHSIKDIIACEDNHRLIRRNPYKTFYYVKIHGTLEPLNIIPPVWNKSLHPEFLPAWKLAYQMISRAKQIRFLGFSFPKTDSYLQYLLKAALVNSSNLQKIDVICLDDENDSIKKR